MRSLTPLLVAAETARDGDDSTTMEEVALRLAAAVTAELAGVRPPLRTLAKADQRRISEVLYRIDSELDQPLVLTDLAGKAAMSPFHFLRTFRAVVGTTPHQYLLRARLHRACLELRGCDHPILTIAYRNGFSDLSTFNRQFRRIIGTSPGTFRAQRQNLKSSVSAESARDPNSPGTDRIRSAIRQPKGQSREQRNPPAARRACVGHRFADREV